MLGLKQRGDLCDLCLFLVVGLEYKVFSFLVHDSLSLKTHIIQATGVRVNPCCAVWINTYLQQQSGASVSKIWVIQQKTSRETAWETQRLLEAGEGDACLVLHPTVDIIVSKEGRRSIRVRNRMVDIPDVIIPRTGSGTGYFGFAILRHLERLGIATVNPSHAIEATKDKLYAHQIFAENHIPTPKTMLVKHPVNPGLVEREIGFPAVVKIMAGSYGRGVYQVTTRARFRDFIEFAHGINTDEAIIVQEYVGHAPGEDLRVFVVGDRVLGAMKRKSLDGSFKANITRGGVGEAYPLTAEIEDLALRVARVLGLEIAGVDLLFGPEGFLVCEANSAPGWQGFEAATGINVAQEIIRYARSKI
jgi:gamma-F420-2:alpha-L-glutamate ligase